MGRVPAGRAFGTRFFICPAEQIKRLRQMPLPIAIGTLTRGLRFKNRSVSFNMGIESCVRDANENPFACLLQKIEVGQPDGAVSLRRHA